MSKQIVKLKVVSAKDVKIRGLGKPSLYVIVNFDGRIRETQVMKKEANPSWNELFEFEYANKDKLDGLECTLELMSKELLKDAKIGTGKVAMKEFLDGNDHEELIELKKKPTSDTVTGRLLIEVKLEKK
jgi:Ca2+-dependent lipid-binding protein